jgi:hypothetical protein
LSRPVARIHAIVPDLMLASRVEESLRAAGHAVEVVPEPPSDHGVDLIVCDIDAVEPDLVADPGVPLIGFYSHVDVETRRRAEFLDFECVIPRSRMSRELPELVRRLLGDG